MTPDEYCDTIRNIAFDRETTKEAFEAGRLAEAAEHAQDLTVAYMDGHARGRDSMRRELEGQEPVSHEFQDRDGKWLRFMNPEHFANTKKDGTWPIRALYARPIPPPDVRELVEAGCNLHMFVDLFAGTDESMRTAASCWRDALAKWGNKV